MARDIKNVGASVRARLLQLAKASGQSFDLVLTRFALERLLFRLSRSPHANRFILKGAMLMMSWFDDPHRGTRDLDLLGFGDPSAEPMLATFRDILAQDADDGVQFDADALRIDRIREELEYGGLRLRTTASISGARISLTIDIGFGDALEPGTEELDYPSMLGFPMPRLRGYARETVIAEKFQAMVALGRANSRMKDFYDIWILSRSFTFDDDRLPRAIAATFERRGTAIPQDLPDALTHAFAEDAAKRRQWRAFVGDLAHDPGDLGNVIGDLAGFLMPKAAAAARLAK
ncbi:nucleotidyl transferase AbiEii/AbiGii toxin family protein [Mesorhizobium sp. M4A.F.Ca.ET.050.02.1.1]|uniref:nucleotidyl transferase AbiEii/AbiGii toxin family protein n=1 Tax=Mesorhizobium sp. M4A.F.Ca.ET.050.02.1.1 TaxID=2496754 RepID=UPI000FCC70AB|nr:nucleotidyl transferase AbiEii/AbiGii toxin family protein [Mesorhizobium sp. M4A.F.Ca.ET.050.02.1.1]RUX51484.1 nucleotidyl transferase AbiEii/AbiGii toxin family protein [Mesorhizobium sp. M4A.F.Ca.ET.050.02.1.1]